jgi:hypothetical protein
MKRWQKSGRLMGSALAAVAAFGTRELSATVDGFAEVSAAQSSALGLLAGALHRQVAGDRQQPAEGRSREVLADRARRVSLRGGFGRRARYRASRKPNAMTNSTAVMMTAVAAPAAILAFSLAVVERMGPDATDDVSRFVYGPFWTARFACILRLRRKSHPVP